MLLIYSYLNLFLLKFKLFKVLIFRNQKALDGQNKFAALKCLGDLVKEYWGVDRQQSASQHDIQSQLIAGRLLHFAGYTPHTESHISNPMHPEKYDILGPWLVKPSQHAESRMNQHSLFNANQ